MKTDGSHSPISFDAQKESYDSSALAVSSREHILKVVCVSCRQSVLYGATIEGLMNIYFRSHWHILEPNESIANMILPASDDIKAVCSDCIISYVNKEEKNA
jgi:hypothetical protein